VGDNFTIAWAAGAAAVAMILALGLSWHELWARPHAPYAWLRRAADADATAEDGERQIGANPKTA